MSQRIGWSGGFGAIQGWLVAAALLSLFTASAGAGTRNYDGIAVTVESPASATSWYGYAVYRMTVTNRTASPRNVTVTLPAESWSYGDSISRLSRTVRVEPNGVATAELLQPPLTMNGSDAQVRIDGQLQRDLVPLSLANHINHYGDGQPILTSRGAGRVLAGNFDNAMTALVEARNASGSPYGGFGGSSDRPGHLARAQWPVNEWSGNWLAYTRYLVVMLTEEELRDAPPAVDSGLRDYVAAGGLLVVIGEDDRLPELMPAWQRAATSEWATQAGNAQAMRVGLGEVERSSADTLAALDADGWEQYIQRSLEKIRGRTSKISADAAEGRLPMLEKNQVPARGLLGMMLLFTLLIGPANIFLLSWMKRRMWLLWTIPAIAFVFAGAVLAYSILSEGVRPRAKTVAVTVLDQTTRQAVTLGFTGYYAPLTPGDGLRFGERTMITPQNSDSGYYGYNRGRPRTIDVTNGQHLSRGWVVARVPAHFDLRTVEDRRERLDITRAEDGGLAVVNGLGLPIKRLILVDAQGQMYEAPSIAAGGSVDAERIERKAVDRESVMEKLSEVGAIYTVNDLEKAPELYASRSTYVAILDDASFVEPGLADLTDHETRAVVVGRWEGAE
ncbi:hypothetical protein [Algisphaera agarilytica]|uniref:Uncharacterized protein n=1 Tax=Algisphaera agarilytica TaxID=1385975 RepID=A0A7X0LKD5_9BACT|nr:hypothetical protein [Algisphaera agarilytica]MBB6428838.1 hypothetical protein [Algisphaera agarilytica]